MKHSMWHRQPRLGMMAGVMALMIPMSAWTAGPVVSTVPWVAGNPLIPHSTYAGRPVTLKGACDRSGDLQWTWDFGDGSTPETGVVVNPYAIQAIHTYFGPEGTIYTARLSVIDNLTGETGNRAYFVQVQAPSLQTEVNVAIDEGLWYLHSTQRRYMSAGVPFGDWAGGGYASSGWGGVTAANLNAFQVNGHLEGGSPENPYTQTVQRAMRRLFEWLTPRAIGLQSNGYGFNLNPDANGNGLGLYVSQGYPYYQGGMFIDAIVAGGTPNAVTTTGEAGVIGRTYGSIVQDMVDDHVWAQYDASPGGGWRYVANEFPDNSACQWAAIGLIAAERNWGLTVPAWVKQWNIPWLASSQHPNGSFGYTGIDPAWGPFATTPSGMVQMAMDGIGRNTTEVVWPDWNRAETFLCDRFGSSGGAGVALKDYYYGLFSFVKSMLLHPGEPITLLRSQTPGVAPVDWYAAEASRGDSTDGVARTLVNDQSPEGYWYGHNYSGDQYPFETAWAIMMLHRTLFESGVPVAVAKAVPNPGILGQVISLDGSDSYHQDPSRSITAWEWDTDSDGTFDSSGPFATIVFEALGDFPVRLRVLDDNTPPKSVETTVTVRITTPPVAPTADADGPYVLCPSWAPWRLDGRRSLNPDEGRSELHSPPYPGDTIQEYAWDLDGDGAFDDASGPTPDVTAFFAGTGPGSYLVYLRVTDTTGSSYPSVLSGDLSDIGTAQVFVLAGDDPRCDCVTLSVRSMLKSIELTWNENPAASSYNIHRATAPGGPYQWIASAVAGPYLDQPGVLNRMYYYVIRPTSLNGDELCQSNEAFAEPLHPEPTALVTPANVSNLKRFYYIVSATSPAFGRMQLGLYVGDTASPLVVGPLPNGSLVYIRTGMAAPSERPGSGTLARQIILRGSARVWAQDPIDQSSTEVLVP